MNRRIFMRGIRLLSALVTAALLIASPSLHAQSAADFLDKEYYDPTSSLNVCAASSSTAAAATTTGPVGSKLFYIGDSLTYHLVRGNDANTAGGKLLEKSAAAGYSVDTNYTYIPDTTTPDKSAPRVEGPSVEAKGGVNIAGTIPNLAQHTADYASADIIVIGLGTNIEANESDLATDINNFVTTIKASNSHAVIYWVNTYYSTPTSVKKTTYQSVNAAITSAAATSGFHIIDYAAAAASNAAIAPDPYAAGGPDGIHVGTVAGRLAKSDWLISQIPKPGSSVPTSSAPTANGCCSTVGGVDQGSTGPTVGDVSADGNPFHILTYPPITDEVGAAKAIDDYIAANSKDSPFDGLGHDFIASGKLNNVNPFLAVAHIKRESGFGTATSGWSATTPPSYNAFGRSAVDGLPFTVYQSSTGPRKVFQWLSWEDSLIGQYNWFSYVRDYFLNPGSKYQSNTFAQYIHHYAPNGDGGNNESVYLQSVYDTIDAMSKNLMSGVVSTVSAGCSGSSPATGDASKYITDCGANDGDAAIACTAINQLGNITYPGKGQFSDAATVASPTLLDCSGLTNMAIYRTFGNNLSLCSVEYKSDTKNFTQIDIHSIKPGDLVGIGAACHSAGGDGHIAVVVSYDAATDKLVTFEASGTSYPSGLRGVDNIHNVFISKKPGDGGFEWAVHYIGPKGPAPAVKATGTGS